MTDALGWRKKFGVIIPSTNTIVEPDFYRMTVPGVTPHISRIHIRDQNLSSDEAFEKLATIYSDFKGAYPEAKYLSAGMSNDFESAIIHGATHIRVGSSILGSRPLAQ